MKRYKTKFDVETLRNEFEKIIEHNSFEDSYHKHSISLLTEDITPDSHIEFHNNLPFNNKPLIEFPYYYSIWKLFSEISEVTCFRIMEKQPHTAYGLHHDKDAGEIMRFQIPIYTNENCWLALTTHNEIAEGWTPDNSYFKKDLEERFGNTVKFYQMEEGYLHRFDTDVIHTLTNEGDTSRYTLLIDVKKIKNVIQFIEDNFVDL